MVLVEWDIEPYYTIPDQMVLVEWDIEPYYTIPDQMVTSMNCGDDVVVVARHRCLLHMIC